MKNSRMLFSYYDHGISYHSIVRQDYITDSYMQDYITDIYIYIYIYIYKVPSRVKWSNPGKGLAPFPTPWCSSY